LTIDAVPLKTTSVGTPAAPKLLLDASVFRDLASGDLRDQEARLLRVAERRSPPLLWVSPTTFDEIVSHIRAEEAHRFQHFRDSLRWVDRLCGNAGTAEALPWILQRGVFAGPDAPYDEQKVSVPINRARRALIKLERFEDVPPTILDAVKQVRADAIEKIDSWAERTRELHAKARVEPAPGEPRIEGKVAVSGAFLEISRKHAEPFRPLWGEFRTDEEQRREQRETIAFELALLQNARNPQGYNVDNHRGDYHDGWLLAYTAAGYHFVTRDARLRSALRMGGCDAPRVVDVTGALDLAEAWLVAEGHSAP
jgi:hypothetical protein